MDKFFWINFFLSIFFLSSIAKLFLYFISVFIISELVFVLKNQLRKKKSQTASLLFKMWNIFKVTLKNNENISDLMRMGFIS